MRHDPYASLRYTSFRWFVVSLFAMTLGTQTQAVVVNAIFVGSSNELGAFESGVAARLLGTVTAVVAGGVASLGVVGVVAARVPQLRRLTELRTTNHELTPSERS